jgi:hypothetical protein
MAVIRIWNPIRGRTEETVKHHKVHYHRHRNPFGFSAGDGEQLLYGTAGYVAARAIPAMVLPNQNTGIMGYALNAGTALAMRLLVGGEAGKDLFIGGLIAVGSRIVSDNFGANIKGLSGDPQFTLGAYWNSYFAVPTVSDPYGRVSASPYPQPALAAPAAAGMRGYAGAAGARTAAGRFGGGRFG